MVDMIQSQTVSHPVWARVLMVVNYSFWVSGITLSGYLAASAFGYSMGSSEHYTNFIFVPERLHILVWLASIQVCRGCVAETPTAWVALLFCFIKACDMQPDITFGRVCFNPIISGLLVLSFGMLNSEGIPFPTHSSTTWIRSNCFCEARAFIPHTSMRLISLNDR